MAGSSGGLRTYSLSISPMNDNPHLEESFKESLKRQFAGVFYRRFT